MSDLSDLDLAVASFECRFEKNFLFWDRAGAIWHELLAKHPSIRMAEAQPGLTVFQLDRKYSLSVTLDKDSDRLNVVGHYPPRTLDEYGHVCEYFVDTIALRLEVPSFTRVGLRLTFVRSFEDREAASAAVMGIGMLRLPLGPHFGVSGSAVLFPELSVRWETKERGCVLRLKAEEIEFNFDPPLGWEASLGSEGPRPFRKKLCRMVYDVDVFMNALVGREQLRAGDWIRDSLHIVNRDSGEFLNVR